MQVNSKLIHCGVDFGTTNSSLCISQNGKVRIIPIDRENTNQSVLKSLIYINPQQQVSVGYGAINSYLNDLATLPSVPLRQVYTGRMIKTFGPSSGGGVGPVIFVPEIVEVDDSGRGRLLQSLKSVLTKPDFTGTDIFGKFYTLEDLLTILLSSIKSRAETEVGSTIDSVVIGRPVRYVGSDQDSLALERMTRIAQSSGFKNVTFEYEPVGAALSYGFDISADQTILVYDFGGGTLDICIMKLPEKKILSVSGRAVGGDLLNRRLVEAKLLQHFGSKALINGRLPFPVHFLNAFTSWYQTTLLKNIRDIDTLKELSIKSNQPKLVNNFINLIGHDYGFEFFQTVDRSKIELSNNQQSNFVFNKPELEVVENILRSEFEKSLDLELTESENCINEALNLAQLTPKDIDRVVLTGGSSQVPIFNNQIASIFSSQKMFSSDHFTAVAQGLAIRSEQIYS